MIGMKKEIRALVALAAGVMLTCTMPALADDTEIFVHQSKAQGIRPNILLVLDTSAAMNTTVTGKQPYDPQQSYDGDCDSSLLYWNRSGTPPDCESDNHIPLVSNRCAAAATSLLSVAGFWSGRVAQWSTLHSQWRNLADGQSQQPIECEDDASMHGPDSGSPDRWARNGDSNHPWTSDATHALDWSGIKVHTLYSANWLNWYHAADDNETVTLLQLAQHAVSTLVHSMSGVNMGLMRFSHDPAGADEDARAEGGMITHPITNIETARDAIVSQANSYTAAGPAPLSEALYEAALYFGGDSIDYGLASHIDTDTPLPSVPESRTTASSTQYKTPIEHSCQRNFIVLLTGGVPQGDHSGESKIATLLERPCTGSGEGRCLDDLAGFLTTHDISNLPGSQHVQTYAIGFGPSSSEWDLVQSAALAGGGQAFRVTDIGSLNVALHGLMSELLQQRFTFTAPAVAVGALNRTQSSNDLYVSVFQPEATLRWPGNVKKYGLRDGRIVDATGSDAIDSSTGFFKHGIRSHWSSSPDGNDVGTGGAASQLPDPERRKIFTYIASAGDRHLDSAANRFDVDNPNLTDALLGTGEGTRREDVIRWARGFDVLDSNQDGSTADARRAIGDPLHTRPAVVEYGGPDDAVVFIPTNDGYLHTLDAQTGTELWAFIPPELLKRLVDLYNNPAVTNRTYGLDGDIQVLRFDANQNDTIEASAGDKVWIYFGMRRGGRSYYALDVTNRMKPQLMWILGPSALPGIGETWSTPTITRIHVAGETQNGERFVLIFGGGYDEGQENYTYSTDDSGNRIYMVDAASGRLLWYCGGPGGVGFPDLFLPQMRHSIPGRIVSLDTNGDHLADRLYAADLGGQIWRFDIANGSTRESLVTGGVLASLGAADANPPELRDTRRFYNAPDVALIQRRGADPYFNLAIGSGYRGHPLHAQTHDRFYSIRDKRPYGRMSQAEYNELKLITEADLIDITTNLESSNVPFDAHGWKLDLRLNGGWNGEKVLAEALTVDGTIFFSTYQPLPPTPENPCLPASRNRVYALQVDTGRPAVDFNNDQQTTAADASLELAQGGIASEVSLFLDSSAQTNTDAGDGAGTPSVPGQVAQSDVDELGRKAVCVVGVEVLSRCVAPRSINRTFWHRATEGSME